MQVHVIQTGRLVGNKTFLRGGSWSSLLRRREDYEFPILCFVLEGADGLIAIDSGVRPAITVPRAQRRFVPTPALGPDDEVGAQMRARGLDPADVRTVVVTHLDWDHVGGIAAFPGAEVLVHRPELEFASKLMGRVRYQTSGWPNDFRPVAYDLDPEPLGPFPRGRAITRDVHVVPIPGHSVGQVGVVVQTGDRPLLFVADHMLRADWFAEDYAAGLHLGLGIFFPELARETSRRIHDYAADAGAVLLPSHDARVPGLLAETGVSQTRAGSALRTAERGSSPLSSIQPSAK